VCVLVVVFFFFFFFFFFVFLIIEKVNVLSAGEGCGLTLHLLL